MRSANGSYVFLSWLQALRYVSKSKKWKEITFGAILYRRDVLCYRIFGIETGAYFRTLY